VPREGRIAAAVPYVVLTLAGLVVAYGVLFAATPVAQARGDAYRRQLIATFAIGALGLICVWTCPGRFYASLGGGLKWLVFLPPAYAFFQVVPLPLGLVRILSPARARLAAALGPVLGLPAFVPLSVAPSATLLHALQISACVVLFLVVYGTAARMASRTWTLVVPLIVIATAEGALGLLQSIFDPSAPDSIAIGTYAIRNHYAGLLEMVLPFAALFPLHLLQNSDRREGLGLPRAFLACLSLAAAAVMLSGAVFSLSRMGTIAAVSSLVFVAVLAAVRRKAWFRNAFAFLAAVCAALVLIALLAPAQLVSRFAQMDPNDRTPPESRDLIAAYPLFGCGLGGYGSAFTAYKRSAPTLYQDYAHNDYVQYLAELGLVGFAVYAAPVVLLIGRLPRAYARYDLAWLTLAGAGSLFAIGLHSLVDFNLYVPANRFVLAWILAVVAYAGGRARQWPCFETTPIPELPGAQYVRTVTAAKSGKAQLRANPL
jgi:O-antigen ligase